MMPDNNWYGHRSILARFCNIKDQPIFGLFSMVGFQHILKFYFQTKKLDFLNTFCWNSEFKKKANSIGFKNFYTIGSPFLYLCKLKGFNYDNYNNKEKVLYFFLVRPPMMKEDLILTKT